MGMLSAIGSTFGMQSGNTGGAGLNYQAGSSPLIQAATGQQAQDLYNNVQSGLNQQQAFVNALQAQGTQGMGAQTALSSMLMNQAQGGGPNPAQAMLAQSTGRNVANQAALMAAQRGASQNVGLMARQAAQQGAQTQQQAAGQAASMQAQQSLAAQNQLQNLANTQVSQQGGALANYNTEAQNAQQNVLNSIAQLNNASVANMASQNSANAGISQIAAKGQQDTLGGLMGGIGNGAMGLAMAKGGMVKHYAEGGQSTMNDSPDQIVADAAMSAPKAAPAKSAFQMPSWVQKVTSNSPTASAQSAGPIQGNKQSTNPVPALQSGGNSIGYGIGSGIRSGVGAIGGLFSSDPNAAVNSADPMATMGHGTEMSGGAGDQTPSAPSQAFSNMDETGMMFAARGGKVPAMLSPGEIYLAPEKAKEVVKGKADPISEGKKVPGKAKVKGDSLKNDTVPATLKEGGVVIPRSVLESKTPHRDAYKFVNAVLAKSKMNKGR